MKDSSKNKLLGLIPIVAGLAIYLACTGNLLEAVLPSVMTVRSSMPSPGRKPDTPALAAPDSSTRDRLNKQYGKLPLSFEVNRGQSDARVKFLSRGQGYTLFLTSTEAVLSLDRGQGSGIRGQEPEAGLASSAVLRMKFAGANSSPKMEGFRRLSGESNYFIGSNPRRWRTGVPQFARVRYREVYPGIDLIFYGNQRQLEFDFEVAPGADPGPILMAFDGSETLALDAHGTLSLHMAGGDVRMPKPRVYQKVNGTQKDVACRYVVQDKRRVRFELASYNTSHPLVIDPTLFYATYLGGSLSDTPRAIAADASGSSYVTGSTVSTDFPTRSGAFRSASAGATDAFVTKLDPLGTSFVYSTYLGGVAIDQGNGIAVDSAGNAYVTGTTSSNNFPTTTGAFQTTSGGLEDAFVTKLNATGSGLVYSTYLRGAASDLAQAIAVDGPGSAYITGLTNSTTFPTTVGAFQTANGGGFDGFVTKLNPAGSSPIYSTYLGGSLEDAGIGIAIDPTGSAFITGQTTSTNFPTSAGAFQTVNSGAQDAFVTKLNTGGTGPVYSSYLGGSAGDFGYGIAIDPVGNVYITGATNSANFPTTTFAYQTDLGGAQDAFVTKLNPAGSSLVFSTYLGGSYDDAGFAIGVDSTGVPIITGKTLSADFPITFSGLQFQLGSDHGVFASSDDGASWGSITNFGFTASETNSLAISSNGILYAGTEFHGVFGAFDGWFETNSGMVLKPSVRALAIHPSSPGKIFTGQSCTGVFVSLDGGLTWIECNNGLVPAGSRCVNAFALHPALVTTLYAGTNAGVFKSTDGAGTWSAANTGLTSLIVNTLAVDPLVPTTIYAGTGTTGGLFKSINNGGAWNVTGLSGTPIASLVIDPITPTTLYAATGGGVFRSSDGAATWTASNTGLPPTTNALAIHPTVPTTLYAATNSGVYKSTNSGAFWAPAGIGFGANPIVKTLLIHPTFPSTIFAGLGLPDPDGFIAVLNGSGDLLDYSTFIGGPDSDSGQGVAVDAFDDFYVTGYTQWNSFPVTGGAAQVFPGGSDEGFIMSFLGGQSLGPSVEITLDKTNYVAGDTVTTTEFRFKNTATRPKAVEVKLWLGVAGIPPIPLMDLGADGSFLFPAGWNYDVGKLPLFTVNSSMTEGSYEVSARLLEPVGGDLIRQDLNAFTVSTGVKKPPRSFTGEPPPRVEFTLSKSTYGNGEVVTASDVRLKNPGSRSVVAEIKLCLVVPGFPPISIMNLGASGTFILSPGYDQNLGSMTLLTVTPGMQRGNYEFSARVLTPATGKSLSSNRTHFEVR